MTWLVPLLTSPEAMPCTYHLRCLAASVKEGIRAAGGTPM